jgi:hypothetical protein
MIKRVLRLKRPTVVAPRGRALFARLRVCRSAAPPPSRSSRYSLIRKSLCMSRRRPISTWEAEWNRYRRKPDRNPNRYYFVRFYETIGDSWRLRRRVNPGTSSHGPRLRT